MVASSNVHNGVEPFNVLFWLQIKETHKKLRRGDIVGVIGHPGRTKTGELSV